MSGNTEQRAFGTRQLPVRIWSSEEEEKFERDFYTMIALYSKYVAMDSANRHILADIYYNARPLIKLFGQLCGNEIEPNPGSFGGMMDRGGYVMRKVRPDDLWDASQGRTFDYDCSSLTANNWYAVLDTNAIGGAAAGGSLYLRKFLGVMLLGIMDPGGNPLFDEFQWLDMEGSTLPIYNAVENFRASDLAWYEFPSPVLLRPAKKYGMSGKANSTAGTGALIFMGVTFVRYEDAITQQPTQPATTAP